MDSKEGEEASSAGVAADDDTIADKSATVDSTAPVDKEPTTTITEQQSNNRNASNDNNNGNENSEKNGNDIAKEENEKTIKKAPTDDDVADAADTKKVDGDTNASQPAPPPPPQEKMSKSQLKRQRKWEQAQEIKRRRKEQGLSVKIAKAKAAGRDRDAERKEMEENRKDGQGWLKRNEKWKENFDQNGSKYQICLDCSFEDIMTEKEVNSLSLQIRYCYASNKKAKHPVVATVTSLKGKTLENLENVSGFEQWHHRAFNHTEKGLLETFPDKSKLVYLTSDSENVLETLEDDKIYIIGGIVDRNRLKRAAIGRAEEHGIATAKLPITEYLSMVSTKVLTCNHVFDILLKYKEHDNDWKKTLLDVLPVRKDAKAKG